MNTPSWKPVDFNNHLLRRVHLLTLKLAQLQARTLHAQRAAAFNALLAPKDPP